jgi:hypothetical protein
MICACAEEDVYGHGTQKAAYPASPESSHLLGTSTIKRLPLVAGNFILLLNIIPIEQTIQATYHTNKRKEIE